MPRHIEHTLENLQKWLPYVASDADRYGVEDLPDESREFHLAAQAIDETLPHPSLASLARGPLLRIRIGAHAVDAFNFRKLPYDFLESQSITAEPNEVHNLLFKRRVNIDVLNPRKIQPVFGHLKYFDLATLARTLKDGGELTLTEPVSSSNE